MKRFLRTLVYTVAALALVAVGALFYIRGRGVSARPEPSWIEARTALLLRSWLTPPRYKGLNNPASASTDNITAGREHFADHCATCHANDGSGNTEMGRNFYPKAPDMRLPRTQGLSDGELFYIIENGIRLTGMPGWSNGTPEGERSSWHLVHFIRHLPSLTPEELKDMERLNPRSGAEIDEARRIEEFLKGADAPASPPPDPHAGHKPPQ
ncbi:MAG: cytochrome c [Acidobacteriota bacterium]|nr:cytochrome c [Acidobacteriota bacterium]